jgi:hypothetical protein
VIGGATGGGGAHSDGGGGAGVRQEGNGLGGQDSGVRLARARVSGLDGRE